MPLESSSLGDISFTIADELAPCSMPRRQKPKNKASIAAAPIASPVIKGQTRGFSRETRTIRSTRLRDSNTTGLTWGFNFTLLIEPQNLIWTEH